ncbi:MAG: pilus assembly protein [Planctomycetes bacterium]|nr:pilus assembly protein [Planctomycetota bacterium]
MIVKSSNSIRRRSAAHRRGYITAELIFVIPILMALLLAIVEFGLLLIASERIQLAAATACRVGTQPSADPTEQGLAVEEAVHVALGNTALATNALVLFTPGAAPGDFVTVQIDVPMSAASPDLLAMFGFSLKDRFLVGRAVMIQQ